MKYLKKSSTLLPVTVFLGAFFAAPTAFADNWGVHISPGGWGFHYGDRDSQIHIDTTPQYYYQPQPYPYVYQPNVVYPRRYYPSGRGPYYPQYNPVVRRDVEQGGVIAPDGTAHTETKVEDRHASYYSPGRNEAVTEPQTTITRRLGPDGVWRTVEHTRWIGADGKPHSTTVERETVQDIWGNTHTNTDVTLKNVQKDGSSGSASQGDASGKETKPPKGTPPAGQGKN